MKTSALYRLDKRDSEKLSQLLTECFQQDPLYCQLIPQKNVREKILPDLFSCDLDEMFETCEVYADSKDVNGILIVSDETEPYNPLRYAVTEAFYWLKTAFSLIKDDWSFRTLIHFMKGKEYLDSSWTKKLGDSRRLHIVYFAVRPSMRGKGIASKLMNAVLTYADENKMVTSLETHNRKNVHLYEHYGFRIFETLQKHVALKQFCMIR